MKAQTTKPEEKLLFHQRTHIFDLSVAFTRDQKLKIIMKDFVELAIYFKQYTENDIGKEINRKMEILDVYTAFAQTKQKCSEQIKEKKSRNQLHKYQFGRIVESGDNKFPCYKIDKKGRITTYLSLINVRNNEKVIYESNLKLTKVRNMTEAEISAEKEKFQKYYRFKLRRQIQAGRKEKKDLMKRVVRLQEDKKTQREEFIEMLRLTRQQLLSKTTNLQQKMHSTNKFLQQSQQNLQKLNKKLEKDLHQTNQQLNITTKQFERTIQVLKQSKQLLEVKVDFIKDRLIARNQKILQEQISGREEFYLMKEEFQRSMKYINQIREIGVPQTINNNNNKSKYNEYQQQQHRVKKRIMEEVKVSRWSQLSDRVRLYLGECGLRKLPDHIGNLLHLTQLWLYGNKLTEVPPTLTNLPHLQTLDLSSNNLTQLPQSLGQLTNLQRLHLQHNQLRWLPDSLGELGELKQLYIYNNKLTEFPIQISKLQKLQQLSLAQNKLTINLQQIICLKDMKILGMSKSQVQTKLQIQQLQLNYKQRGIKLVWCN